MLGARLVRLFPTGTQARLQGDGAVQVPPGPCVGATRCAGHLAAGQIDCLEPQASRKSLYTRGAMSTSHEV